MLLKPLLFVNIWQKVPMFYLKPKHVWKGLFLIAHLLEIIVSFDQSKQTLKICTCSYLSLIDREV